MKRLLARILPGLLLMTLLCAEEPVTWRSKGGHSFEGTFVRLHPGKSVVLKGVDGKTVDVPLAALDEATQKLALKKAKAAGQPTTKPLFQHQTPIYTLDVYSQKRSFIKLEFKDRGKPLIFGNPDLHLFMAEVVNKKYNTIAMKEVKLTDQSRESASFEVLFENDVVMFLEIDLLKDGIEYRYWRTEPDTVPKMDLHISMVLPTLIKWDLPSKTYKGELFPDGVVPDRLTDTLKDYTLMSYYHNEPAKKHAFDQHYKKLYTAKAFALSVPNSSGKIELACIAERNQGKVGLHLYDGKMLAEGTMIRFGNFHPTDREKAATFRIRYN